MKKIIGRILIILFLLVLTLLTLAPLIWTVISSFKTAGELMLRPWSMPATPQFKNYADAWRMGNFGTYFMNSIIITGFSLLLMILLGVITFWVIKLVAKHN